MNDRTYQDQCQSQSDFPGPLEYDHCFIREVVIMNLRVLNHISGHAKSSCRFMQLSKLLFVRNFYSDFGLASSH